MTTDKIIVLGHNSTTSTQIWVQDPVSGLWTLLYNHSGVGTALRSSVVGCSGGQIIASIQGKPHHYEGGVWTEKDAISGFAFRLHAANRSYNAVWALCYPSSVYTAIWDGSTWGPSRYCATAAMDLWAASATEAWVVGTSAILHTTDGGVNWTNLYSQAQSETGINIPVYCVYGWNANEVYFLGHGGSYGASGTRSKLIRWNGANFFNVTMDIIRLNHPTVGHNPPVYGTAGQFWFEMWPSYFNQGYSRQLWGISSSQVVFTASEWSWNAWTWNGSVCEEREYVGSSWGTGQPRIAGLSSLSRVVSVPRGSTAGVVAKETYDGGVTWHAVDASFPSSLLYKDIGLLTEYPAAQNWSYELLDDPPIAGEALGWITQPSTGGAGHDLIGGAVDEGLFDGALYEGFDTGWNNAGAKLAFDPADLSDALVAPESFDWYIQARTEFDDDDLTLGLTESFDWGTHVDELENPTSYTPEGFETGWNCTRSYAAPSSTAATFTGPLSYEDGDTWTTVMV